MIPLARLNIDDAEIEELANVLRSGMWASGQIVSDFENEFSSYCGVKHAVAVNNGTAALQVALHVLGIRPGTFVVTTPFTFIATSATIVSAGAIPVFVDIDPATYLIDLNQLEDALKKFHPAAASVVHLYGQSCDGQMLSEICQRFDCRLIEDCAQAQGATWGGQHVGSFGSLGTHSFYATKNLPTGEGGMVVTNDAELAAKIRRNANHGRLAGYEHIEIGQNLRMTNITACLGRQQLAQLDGNNARRMAVATRYSTEINNPLITHPQHPSTARHVFHQYTVRTGQRDQLKDFLHAQGIQSAVVYPKLSYQQSSFQCVPHVNLGCPQAELACEQVLSIPVHPRLTDDEVQQVIDACNAFRPQHTKVDDRKPA